MKKRIGIAIFAMCAFALFAGGGSDSSDGEQLNWRFCNGVTDTHPQSITLQKFADEFSKATDGRVNIEVYFNNSLGGEDELTELTRTNTLQGFFGNVTTGLPSFIPEFGAFALPYLFRSFDDASEYLNESELAAGLWAELEDLTSLHYVGVSLNSVRALTTSGIRVNGPEDLKGTKVRSMTAQVWQDVISSLGATPVPIAFPELYVALQTGVVEGQDNGIANVYDAKFYEVQDYYHETNHGYTISGFFTNTEAFNSLTSEEQVLFEELFYKYCVVEYDELMDDFYQEGFNKAAETMTIVRSEDMDMQSFYDNAAKLVDEKYMDDPVYSAIVNDVRSYFNYQ